MSIVKVHHNEPTSLVRLAWITRKFLKTEEEKTRLLEKKKLFRYLPTLHIFSQDSRFTFWQIKKFHFLPFFHPLWNHHQTYWFGVSILVSSLWFKRKYMYQNFCGDLHQIWIKKWTFWTWTACYPYVLYLCFPRIYTFWSN